MCLKTLRKRALKVGRRIEKGFQHYTVSGAIFKNVYGEKYPGYMVRDLSTGKYEWGCYDENYTHLWKLEDVENFLKEVYEENGLKW